MNRSFSKISTHDYVWQHFQQLWVIARKTPENKGKGQGTSDGRRQLHEILSCAAYTEIRDAVCLLLCQSVERKRLIMSECQIQSHDYVRVSNASALLCQSVKHKSLIMSECQIQSHDYVRVSNTITWLFQSVECKRLVMSECQIQSHDYVRVSNASAFLCQSVKHKSLIMSECQVSASYYVTFWTSCYLLFCRCAESRG
jgi:hypothetical protein